MAYCICITITDAAGACVEAAWQRVAVVFDTLEEAEFYAMSAYYQLVEETPHREHPGIDAPNQ